MHAALKMRSLSFTEGVPVREVKMGLSLLNVPHANAIQLLSPCRWILCTSDEPTYMNSSTISMGKLSSAHRDRKRVQVLRLVHGSTDKDISSRIALACVSHLTS